MDQAGFATGSTTSVTAVNGIATFSNLVLNTAGSYTLTCQRWQPDEWRRPAAITVSAAAAAKVVFQQVPTTGTAGQPCHR